MLISDEESENAVTQQNIQSVLDRMNAPHDERADWLVADVNRAIMSTTMKTLLHLLEKVIQRRC